MNKSMDPRPPERPESEYARSVRSTHTVAIQTAPLISFPFTIDDQLGITHERRQIRFPRSKKRRIRRKWSKQPRNFKTTTRQEPAAYQMLGVVVMNSAMFRKLRKSLTINT